MIRLTAAQRREIEAHGEETYPHECCGFLLGQEEEEVKAVREVRRAPNAREDSPQNRYLIPPDAMLKAEKAARQAGQQILGFYHSHPDVPARPSQFDRDHAWPWYSYLIVSVRAGAAAELLAWIVPEEADGPLPTEPFQAEELIVED
jgi:proteasome lid subunit RPN8/RPN11